MIFFSDFPRFGRGVLSILSYCSLERSEKAVDLPAVFLRAFAASESRVATAKSEYRRGSEVWRVFCSFSTSSFVTDCLRVGATFQSLDNTQGAGQLDEPDVDLGMVAV